MKRIGKLLLTALLAVCLAFAISSCQINLSSGGGNNNGGNNNNNNNNNGGDNGGGPAPDVEETCTITYKFENNVLFTQEVGVETGFTEEHLAEIAACRYHGFGFADWYKNQYIFADNTKFDFTKAPTTDTIVYGDRSNLAGDSATWTYDSATCTLKILGEGEMYNYLYNSDAPWRIYSKTVKNIEIAEGITTVGDWSFNDFTEISVINLPSTIVTIGKGAFKTSSVSVINFPDGLLEIGETAFQECQNLSSLYFNEGLSNIGSAAFYRCKNLELVFLTNEIMRFGTSAFYECDNIYAAYYKGTEEEYNAINILLDNFWIKELTNTYFYSEQKPTFDNRGAYWHYDSEGEIEQWYYTISYYYADNAKVPFTFDYIDAETAIVREGNVTFLNSIGYHGYNFCSWHYRGTGDDFAPVVGDSIRGDIQIVGSRSENGWWLAGDNVWVKYRSGVLTIKCEGEGTGKMYEYFESDDAPWAGYGYSKVVFQDTLVTSIGNHTFCNNNNIISITIPANVTNVSPRAFNGCGELKYVLYGGDEAALDAAGLNSLYEPRKIVTYAYSESGVTGEGKYWRTLTVGSMTKVTAWEYRDGHLTVGGSDPTMINYTADTLDVAPWYSYRESVTGVTVREGISVVGHYTFDGMSALTSATLPNTVTRISEMAFKNTLYYRTASNWTNGALYISNHLIKVDPAVFTGSLFILAGTKDGYTGTVSIAENAFEGCSNIKEILITKTLKGIYSTALVGLTNLEKVYYAGSYNEWKNIENVPTGDGITVYYYSTNDPGSGEYWRYDGDLPAIWERSSSGEE
ncbi:MAG: leucine-rich repeat protein [Clostridia bacterium]|nr:leucine-rich repeat protein [Clostridia bacterium]